MRVTFTVNDGMVGDPHVNVELNYGGTPLTLKEYGALRNAMHDFLRRYEVFDTSNQYKNFQEPFTKPLAPDAFRELEKHLGLQNEHGGAK